MPRARRVSPFIAEFETQGFVGGFGVAGRRSGDCAETDVGESIIFQAQPRGAVPAGLWEKPGVLVVQRPFVGGRLVVGCVVFDLTKALELASAASIAQRRVDIQLGALRVAGLILQRQVDPAAELAAIHPGSKAVGHRRPGLLANMTRRSPVLSS